jgi:hypothetical protein
LDLDRFLQGKGRIPLEVQTSMLCMVSWGRRITDLAAVITLSHTKIRHLPKELE